MKTGFYPKLAWNGIRKNKKLYVPYLLTCIGMVMMYYIILFLQYSDTLSHLPGAGTVRSMFQLGGWVIAIFAAVFLFYTNSFLVRRRKKEFGLYNILGMGKGNIGRILLWESLISAGISLAVGLTAGIILSKLAELVLVHVLKGDITYTLSVSPAAIFATAAVFCVIFALLFLHTLHRIRLSSAIILLRSEQVGEKPPKANWFFALIGAIMLFAAYWIAVSIENPISALMWFFVAVLLVIAATYLLFVAGSVVFCRLLQKNKRYYYRANHFVSVSSMTYRMKRNGAGLASICILATMVLVMISSTTSLYFGAEDSLHSRYPKEINLDAQFKEAEALSDDNISALREAVIQIGNEYGAKPQNIEDYRYSLVTGLLQNDVLETDVTKVNQFQATTFTFADLYQIYIIPLSDYNRLMQTSETLAENEILLYVFRAEYHGDTLAVNGGATFRIKKQLDSFIKSGNASMNVLPTMYLIVPDLQIALKGLLNLADFNGDRMLSLRWSYGFDTQLAENRQTELNAKLRETLREYSRTEKYGIASYTCDSREANRSDFYATFGSFFFLGILLSLVFLLAAVLIIYYKQVSEGYEDQARFEIMQKVGMTKKEIRKSINSQLLTIFFLPLIGAGLHLAFAFPMIRKLLLLFNLNNVLLFSMTTLISFLVFALFYTIVYRITSNTYYHIVSGIREEK